MDSKVGDGVVDVLSGVDVLMAGGVHCPHFVHCALHCKEPERDWSPVGSFNERTEPSSDTAWEPNTNGRPANIAYNQPDLIAFTASSSQTVLSTSYRGIELFSAHRYDFTVPVASDADFGPVYYVAGIDSTNSHYTFKTAVYNATETVPFNISFEGVTAGTRGKLTVLTAPDGLSGNMLINGTVVEVVTKSTTNLVAGEAGSFEFELENYSIAVLTT